MNTNCVLTCCHGPFFTCPPSLQQLAEANQTIRERTTTTNEMKHLLESQKNNNKETDRKLIISRHQGLRLRQDLKEQEKNCNSLKDEVGF